MYCNIYQLEARYEDDRLGYEEEITVLRENLEKMRQLEAEIKVQVSLYLSESSELLTMPVMNRPEVDFRIPEFFGYFIIDKSSFALLLTMHGE